jgi:hypothetical protein
MMEKTTRESILQDATPHVFEQALNYLQNPVATKYFEAAEAVQLVEFYDKYELPGGLALCDSVLSDYLTKNMEAGIDTMPEDLDLSRGSIIPCFSVPSTPG